MRILFGLLLLIFCLTVRASDERCSDVTWRGDDYSGYGRRFFSNSENFFEVDKTWIFCYSLKHDTEPKLWTCDNDKTLNELVEKNKPLQNEVEKRGLCNITVTSQTGADKQKVTDLQIELNKKEDQVATVLREQDKKKEESGKCHHKLTKLKEMSASIESLQEDIDEQQASITKEKKRCDKNITQYIAGPQETRINAALASLQDLKETLKSLTRNFEEGMKKRSCTACSAETCYSTPSVKAELDKMYLENSWLNLTAAQREQCLLDDTMLLPMLSYMRRKPFDGAYAYNQNVDMMEKLFALLISFLCFLI
ncbi:hypothetical protein, conserved [Trypanosoma brucei brucei TREU927]|uniref:Uncharacterized protein n=1 Tax=Trypanosoma brucei brucei (strain 927/4 GUTat10.1) TaxID=185431 RepID=Q38EG8_TRYB2|nr:hypothetical protein, conserved [Trypanosoma brucei brucei TREU927]EAN76802.1 hypothetical protein, conserved [Trypanosoma brucei brucei TREU927]